MDGWFFSAAERVLSHGDGRPIAVGTTHEVVGPPIPCAWGLHACDSALSAFFYAPVPIVWRVRLAGDIAHGDDKACATSRTYLSGGVDASEVIDSFFRKCALDVAHLWDAPEVVLEFLKTGKEELMAAAKDAAWGASEKAAWNVIEKKAWLSSWGVFFVPCLSTLSAAEATAWASLFAVSTAAANANRCTTAEESVALESAMNAARANQNRLLESALYKLIEGETQ